MRRERERMDGDHACLRPLLGTAPKERRTLLKYTSRSSRSLRYGQRFAHGDPEFRSWPLRGRPRGRDSTMLRPGRGRCGAPVRSLQQGRPSWAWRWPEGWRATLRPTRQPDRKSRITCPRRGPGRGSQAGRWPLAGRSGEAGRVRRARLEALHHKYVSLSSLTPPADRAVIQPPT
jgi:hypothetical protein